MEILSDVSATSAMVRATIEAESNHRNSITPCDWQSSLANLLIPHASQSAREEGVRPDISRCKFKQRPIKSIPLPSAITLDNVYLSDRITSLQNIALVGRWHFPIMDDAQMRNWLGSQWNSLLGYIPTMVRLMKDWYSFHFLSSQDLEAISTLPWVHSKSFLALHKWYIGYNPLHNTPTNNLIWVKLPGLPIELWTKERYKECHREICLCGPC